MIPVTSDAPVASGSGANGQAATVEDEDMREEERYEGEHKGVGPRMMSF
jgi:hypothetical protein